MNVNGEVSLTGRKTKLSQLLNAVSVAASGSSNSSWIDCDGHSAVKLTFMNDAVIRSYGHLQWSHDGVTLHSEDLNIIADNTNQRKTSGANELSLGARYLRVSMVNPDTVPHTMSCWAFLKV